jgi:hypothetical protein
MYFLWGMINGLQLIALTCLFKIRLPSNVMSVNIEILKIAAFDLFQSDWILMKIFNFSDTPSISPEFEEASFEGANFIIGNGPIVLFMIGYFFFLLVRWVITRQFRGERKNCYCNKLVPWFESHNIEATTIRFVLEGNIDILFWAMIALLHVRETRSTGEKFQDRLSNMLAIAMLIVLIYAPVHAIFRAV